MTAREKLKKELASLLEEGLELIKKFEDKKEEPVVHFAYQDWYSRSLKAVKWLAPDRYEEFRRYYEPDPKRKTLGYGTYVIQDYLKSVKPGHILLEDFDCRDQALGGLFNQYAILNSLAKRIDSALEDIQGTLHAELQDEEIETATQLLKVNARAAGALAGVILESHLQKVAERHDIKIRKKSPTIADLNEPMKSAGVYDIASWRKISYLADIRNLCSHKKADDPTPEQVAELVDGVRWAVKNIS